MSPPMAFTKFFSKSKKRTTATATTSSPTATPRTTSEYHRNLNDPMEVYERLQKTNTAWARALMR
ncbi:hypothetical protein IW138_004955 [Coemansia sp. RSA 986]|nr:hypothetical protein LPJ74_003977 [Coemansia sp. RSA 1843]KAJ2087495.1 hypothetical protein IW138_004955 [Coemansia sp. RSA 986]